MVISTVNNKGKINFSKPNFQAYVSDVTVMISLFPDSRVSDEDPLNTLSSSTYTISHCKDPLPGPHLAVQFTGMVSPKNIKDYKNALHYNTLKRKCISNPVDTSVLNHQDRFLREDLALLVSFLDSLSL